MEIETKICSCCKQIKPISMFNKQAKNPDGLKYYCRLCQSIKNHQWSSKYYQNNKDKVKARTKKYYQEHKEYYKTYNRDYYLYNKVKDYNVV